MALETRVKVSFGQRLIATGNTGVYECEMLVPLRHALPCPVATVGAKYDMAGLQHLILVSPKEPHKVRLLGLVLEATLLTLLRHLAYRRQP